MKTALYFTALLALACCARGPIAPSAKPVADTQPSAPDDRTHVGNGGDDNALRDNAWFTGSRKITVCLESEPAYEAAAKTSVEKAFRLWRRYLKEKHLGEAAFYPERASLPARYALAEPRLQWQDCAEQPDLRIVVGETGDAALNWARLNDFSGRSAFVIRREYNVFRGYGRGVMWVASPSRLGESTKVEGVNDVWLTGHILHELGHVLGCGHVPGTLMAEDFIQVLDKAIHAIVEKPEDAEDFAYLALWPDQKRELLTCAECELETKRAWVNTHWDAFDFLFGTKQMEKIVPLYDLNVTKRQSNQPYVLRFSSVNDPTFVPAVPLEKQELTKTTYGDVPIFKITFQDGPKDSRHVVQSFQTTLEYRAEIARQIEGEVRHLPLLLQRNGPRGAIILQIAETPAEDWLFGTRTGPIGPPREDEE